MSAQRSYISDEAGEAVLHYKRKLSRHLEDESPDIVLHCLDKLEQIPVNISILQDTGIGKVVNHLKKSESADESVIEKARSIVLKWKEIVANEEQELQQAEEEKDEESDNQESESDASDDEVDEEPPVLSPEIEPAPSPPPSKPSSSSKHSSSKKDDSSKKSSKREDDSSSSRSKSSSKEKEKSSSNSSSSKHKHGKEELSSWNKKKKKDKDRDREKEREKEKEKVKEKSKRTSSSSGADDKKRKEDEDVAKSRKRKHESSLSEEDGEKARKRKHESDRKQNLNSLDEKSKKSSTKKPAETNGFEAALLGEAKISSSKDKKDKHKDSRKKSETSFKDEKHITLPPPPVSVPIDLNPNYNPLKSKPVVVATPAHNYTHLTDGKTDDEALSALISMSKNAKRTAVYSGSKRSVFGKGSVPRLTELCIHKLQEHVELLHDCKAVEYKVIEPVLERAKPETLINIEDRNPYLMEDTGTLWERICRKQFPKEARQEFEAWREMYERCTYDRKKKLDFLSNKLNNSYKNVKDNERKTKLAYVDGVAKAPRNFQRAQDKNGTGAVVSTQAMRKLTGPPPLPKSAREVGSSGGSGGAAAGPPAASKKPKVAPMMAKTLKMVRGLKVNFRR